MARLRERADNMAASGAALKKIADAADPLYKTLDDGQKRRLKILTHMEHRFGGDGGGWRHREFERGMDGGDRGTIGQRPGDHGGPWRFRSGSDERLSAAIGDQEKPPESGGFSAI